jgi:putative endonuclease
MCAEEPTPVTTAQTRGQMAYHAGLSAEGRIALDYERRGFAVARRRWRGAGGEIDLITRDADGLVFVEVKKSRSFASAADRLSRRQMDRIYASAAQFLATEPDGEMTNVRFDVALVDQSGAFRIIENAFGNV